MRAFRILGVDPGSRRTGYGCIDVIGNQIRLVAHGTLKLSNVSGKSEIPLEKRLLLLHEKLTAVIGELKPSVLAIERVFFAKNALSALKLGQARGVAILSGAIHGLEIAEYSPNEIKMAVVGHGQADKEQVARMVKLLTGCKEFATNDDSDAVAIAICHAQRSVAGQVNPAVFARSKRRSMTLAESLGLTAKIPEREK
jgi:crossover junction endodeoxyribonuclease RuvC